MTPGQHPPSAVEGGGGARGTGVGGFVAGLVSLLVGWLVPVVGVVWFWVAYRVWRRQLDRYASTGT